MGERMSISVVVPSYRRPHDLPKCLAAIDRQDRPPDEVIVVHRGDDLDTIAAVQSCQSTLGFIPKLASVHEPGLVAALNRGLDAAGGDIIAIIDDDTTPWPDWLTRIESTFRDPSVDAVGGRDDVYHQGVLQSGNDVTVGKIQWFGRMIGNHRSGIGPPRRVEFLKGANMAFRSSSIAGIRFDTRLRGSGAQVHIELPFCLSLLKRNGHIVYDPEIRVDHFEAPRMDEDKRCSVVFGAQAQANAVFNETIVLLEYLSPPRRVAFVLWAILIGTRAQPGVVQLFRIIVSRRPYALRRFVSTLQGRYDGMLSYAKTCWGGRHQTS